MGSQRIAEVVLDRTIGNRSSAIFHYRIPSRLGEHIQPGQLVWVPLRNEHIQGIVFSIIDHAEPSPVAPDQQKLRDIADIADPEAVIPIIGLRLAEWIAQTTLTPLSLVLRHFLPPGLSQETVTTWQVTPYGKTVNPATLPIADRGILYYLQQHGEKSEPNLTRELRVGQDKLREICLRLHKQDLITSGQEQSRPRVTPRLEQRAQLLIAPDALEHTLEQLDRAPAQQKVVRWLAAQYPIPTSIPITEITTATGASNAIVRALEKKHILEISGHEVLRSPLIGAADPDGEPSRYAREETMIPSLTPGQRQVWEPLSAALKQLQPSETLETKDAVSSHQVFLLHGVTGSGKTEIYLRAAAQVLRSGRAVIVLVPEIALTVQLVRRFAARFPGQVAVFHSRLAPGERYDEWRRARRGQAKLVIGSRSALFAPVAAPGLIIVDEEHESSYKQDHAPAYHARQVAVQLGKLSGSVVVFGSATPSMESYDAVRRGQWRLLEMPERIGRTIGPDGLLHAQPLPLPRVVIVDMRRELHDGNRSIFSNPLQQALGLALERGEQAILFLNRRGVAQFVLCRDCGHVVRCPTCQSTLVMHSHTLPPQSPSAPFAATQSVLICHTCTYRQLVPAYCPQCLSPRIRSFGIGTQRVEEEVRRLFPLARTLRWDRDSATGKDAHRRFFDTFLRHEADVLIGTQMIAKGLDLPEVSVVGIIEADTSIYLPDFRSGERTFQLLTQVAGRAGRRTAGGLVIVQTYTPDHYAIRAAQNHDYQAFAIQELSFRNQTGYPPSGQLIRMLTMNRNRERCQQIADEMAKKLHIAIQRLGLTGWGIIGPAPAYLQRIRAQWRWHLLIRTPPIIAGTPPLFVSLARVLEEIGPALKGWDIDVEPMNML